MRYPVKEKTDAAKLAAEADWKAAGKLYSKAESYSEFRLACAAGGLSRPGIRWAFRVHYAVRNYGFGLVRLCATLVVDAAFASVITAAIMLSAGWPAYFAVPAAVFLGALPSTYAVRYFVEGAYRQADRAVDSVNWPSCG